MLIFAEIATYSLSYHKSFLKFCQTPVLGLGLGVDFTFAWDNDKNDNNPHLNCVKETVLGDKEQGEGIHDKRYGIRVKGQEIRDKT